jgi:pSer/pThr/pTyr-binding forkhead associated (FHA) protein
MIECPNCHARFVANTLVCSECGALLPPEEWGSNAISTEITGEPIESTAESALPPAVRLYMGEETGQSIDVVLDKKVIIGRSDPANQVFPEIDLAPYGGLEKGVSRRHARLSSRRGLIIIEDLASINGTYLNGKRLTPYLPEVVHDGDQIQIGSLPIRVEVL